MRAINVPAALSGALALAMLVLAAHVLALDAADAERVHLAAFMQLGSAAAGLAIANRAGRLNLVAGVLILGGAALFAGALYALALTQAQVAMLAPIGGAALIAGWIALAFAKPNS